MPEATPRSEGPPSRKSKMRILFLCTGNSCRSQMAEGWTRHLKGREIEPSSAGTRPHGIDRRAVEVMAEAGVDISRHTSKRVDDLAGEPFDYVVTVCDAAREACPVFPARANAKMRHVSFEDPPSLAAGASSEEEALAHYRRVRDEIRAFVETLPEGLDR
jgi:arsenate reductase